MPEQQDNRKERFGSQLQSHRGAIFGYILRRVGDNSAQAEDLTQDCFLRVWERRWQNPPPQGALRTYLLRTAQNLLNDRYRRKRVEMLLDWETVLHADSDTPEATYLARELAQRLTAEVAIMPLELRETLRLRVEESLDYEAIATQQGCPIGTVKSRLNAARSRLQMALQRYQEGTESVTTVKTRLYREQHTAQERIVTIAYKEQKMATSDIKELHAELRSIHDRLNALEGKRSSGGDPAHDFSEQLTNDLEQRRKSTGSPYGFTVVHMTIQRADSGEMGTAMGIRTFESVNELPNDRDLQERFQRIQVLTGDALILKVFRHFFTLRFAGKSMSASAIELADTLGATAEQIETLLRPLVADRTLTLMPDRGKEGMVYEWDGNDPVINALIFAT